MCDLRQELQYGNTDPALSLHPVMRSSEDREEADKAGWSGVSVSVKKKMHQQWRRDSLDNPHPPVKPLTFRLSSEQIDLKF